MDLDSDHALRHHLEGRVGRTLGGKYTLEGLLGVGGMAAVYRGRHRNGNRVAVKILHAEVSLSANIRERFLREGYVANRVDHEGAVRVLDDDLAEDGAPYLVMELLEGQTLEDYILAKGGKLSPQEVLPFIDQLLQVLIAAHAKGIVHRDIKPENLFLTKRAQQLKVLDFGIARLNEQARQATRTGSVMGTPVYMSPEQARGETKLVDCQTDVWAAAAICFRALTGRYVHEAETPEMVMIAVATQRAPLLKDVVPGSDPQLAEVVDRGLASKKEERWPSAEAMLEALRAVTPGVVVNRDAIVGLAKTLEAAPPPALNPFSTTAGIESGPRVPAAEASAAVPARSNEALPSRRKAVGAVAAMAAFGLLAIASVYVRSVVTGAREAASTAASPRAASLLPPASPSTVLGNPTATAEVAASAPTAAAVVQASATTVPSIAVKPVATAPRSPAAPPVQRSAPSAPVAADRSPAAAAAPKASAAPAVSCDPPYFLDAQGTRVFKKECFAK